jgi:hypothetical protein
MQPLVSKIFMSLYHGLIMDELAFFFPKETLFHAFFNPSIASCAAFLYHIRSPV